MASKKYLSEILKGRRADVLSVYKDYNISEDPNEENLLAAVKLYGEPFLAKLYTRINPPTLVKGKVAFRKVSNAEGDTNTTGTSTTGAMQSTTTGAGWEKFKNYFNDILGMASTAVTVYKDAKDYAEQPAPQTSSIASPSTMLILGIAVIVVLVLITRKS